MAKTTLVMTILVETEQTAETVLDMSSKDLSAFLGAAHIVRCDDAEVEA